MTEIHSMLYVVLTVLMAILASYSAVYLYGRCRHSVGQEMPIMYNGAPSIMNLLKDITGWKMVEHDLRESEERYQRLVEWAPEPILVHENGKIQYANPACVQLLGARTLDELKGKSVLDFAPPGYVSLVEDRINRLKMVGTHVAPEEEKVLRLDGSIIDVEVSGISLKFTKKTTVLMMVHDITARKKATEALKASEEKYRLIADYSQDMIKLVDPNGKILYASPSHSLNLGFDAEEVEGQHILFDLHLDDVELFQESLHQAIKEHQSFTIEVRRQHQNGQWIWFESNGTLVMDEKGYIEHLVFTSRNIMERKQYQEKLEYLAFHDSLTGLPNRRFFTNSLEQSLKEAEKQQQTLAMLVMDLDKFKWVNDSLGHDVGDELLIQFAQRVRSCLREKDVFARSGGDEFAIFLPELKSEDEAILVAKRIIAAIQQPWEIGGHSFQTTSSIGISFYPRDGEDSITLVKHADMAMYRAKDEGRNTYKSFKDV